MPSAIAVEFDAGAHLSDVRFLTGRAESVFEFHRAFNVRAIDVRLVRDESTRQYVAIATRIAEENAKAAARNAAVSGEPAACSGKNQQVSLLFALSMVWGEMVPL